MKAIVVTAAACLALAGCGDHFTLETAREAYAKPLGDGRQDDFPLIFDQSPSKATRASYEELVKRDVLRCRDFICEPAPRSRDFLTQYTGDREGLKNTLLVPAAFRVEVQGLKRIVRDENGAAGGRAIAAELTLKTEPQPFYLKHRDIFDSIEKSNAAQCESKPCEIVVNFRKDEKRGWVVTDEQWPWIAK